MSMKGLTALVLAGSSYLIADEALAQRTSRPLVFPPAIGDGTRKRNEARRLEDSETSWGKSITVEATGDSVYAVVNPNININSGNQSTLNGAYPNTNFNVCGFDRDPGRNTARCFAVPGDGRVELPPWLREGFYDLFLVTNTKGLDGKVRNPTKRTIVVDIYSKTPEGPDMEITREGEPARQPEGLLEPNLPNPQCDDGLDNDHDGRTDYREDVGCLNALDNNEENPQCSDSVDNDRDGRIDFGRNNISNDPGCSDAQDDNESDDPRVVAERPTDVVAAEDSQIIQPGTGISAEGYVLVAPAWLKTQFTGSNTRTEGTHLGVGGAAGYQWDRFGLGAYTQLDGQGLRTGDVGEDVTIGNDSGITSFDIGVSGRSRFATSRRGELHTKVSLGYLFHLINWNYGGSGPEEVDFRETGSGLILRSGIAMPGLIKRSGRWQWGLVDSLSLEALSLRQEEQTFGMKADYGTKTRFSNTLSTMVQAGQSLQVRAGWQLDSNYSLAWRDEIPQATLNRIGAQIAAGETVDLSGVTRGNVYGHQLALGTTIKPRSWNGYSLILTGVVPLAGTIERYGANAEVSGKRFGFGFGYERVRSSDGGQRVTNNIIPVVFTIHTDTPSLSPNRRVIQTGR